MNNSALKQSALDKSRIELLSCVKQIQSNHGLSIFDMENILYQILVDIKTEKEMSYANSILDLTLQLRQMEKEKKEQATKEAMEVAEKEE